MTSRPVTLDHLAIGVARWSDGYGRFAVELGGRWSHGGDAGGFAPCQLVYRDGMRLELIAPSSADGFMRRFMDQNGPGPHHITFKVHDLDQALARVAELGIGILGGRTSLPYWQEAFLHPKLCGMGTLIQLVQADEARMADLVGGMPEPADFPQRQRDQRGLAWIGVTATSLAHARSLLVDVLHGDVITQDDGWMLLRWGTGRSLLVRDASAEPGGAELWTGAPTPGVAHVVMGPPDLRPQQVAGAGDALVAMPYEDTTGTPVWLAHSPAASN